MAATFFDGVTAPPHRRRDENMEVIAMRRMREIAHLDSQRMANKILAAGMFPEPTTMGELVRKAQASDKKPLNKVLLLCS